MILVIGSVAGNAAGVVRKPVDVDFIATYDDGIKVLKLEGCQQIYPVQQGKKIVGIKTDGSKKSYYEFEIAWPDSTSERLLNLIWDDSQDMGVWGSSKLQVRFAPLNALYALKMSHRYKKNSPHFQKTMTDIHAMRRLGAEIPDSLQQWYLDREKETYDYGHPKLDVKKSEFFSGDGINYIYDHDSIHLAVKVNEQPAYNYFKPDTSEVLCSKEMFFACDPTIRLNAVYEESAVLALERSIVPHPGVLTPAQAFRKALEKVSTSITSGWFREYAWEHFGQAIDFYDSQTAIDRNYVSLFERGLKAGVVKAFVT